MSLNTQSNQWICCSSAQPVVERKEKICRWREKEWENKIVKSPACGWNPSHLVLFSTLSNPSTKCLTVVTAWKQVSSLPSAGGMWKKKLHISRTRASRRNSATPWVLPTAVIGGRCQTVVFIFDTTLARRCNLLRCNQRGCVDCTVLEVKWGNSGCVLSPFVVS